MKWAILIYLVNFYICLLLGKEDKEIENFSGDDWAYTFWMPFTVIIPPIVYIVYVIWPKLIKTRKL